MIQGRHLAFSMQRPEHKIWYQKRKAEPLTLPFTLITLVTLPTAMAQLEALKVLDAMSKDEALKLINFRSGVPQLGVIKVSLTAFNFSRSLSKVTTIFEKDERAANKRYHGMEQCRAIGINDAEKI
jgi:hypothetical protein